MSLEKPINIQKDITTGPALNYALLRKEGIRHVQELSGKIWTDYNYHDPGVTILEHLCYALTDLGYRTEFNIEDILNARRKLGKTVKDTFFDPISILPSSPITKTDYRILLIDGIPEIKNVWVELVKDNAQGIKGLYRILVQLKEEPDSQAELNTILRRIKELYHENRNLCEDLEEIQILKADRITFSADIDIESDVISESVLAQIYFQIEDQLIKGTRVYTLKELVAEGADFGQIFDGPLTTNGFLKPEELKPLPSEIYISNLIEAISQVKGVRTIRNFQVYLNEIPVEGDIITISEGHFPFLDNRLEYYIQKKETYPIRFHRGSLQDTLDLATVFQLLYNLLQTSHGGYKIKKNQPLYKEPAVSLNDLERYYSIQHNFPKTYGIGPYGLPYKASRDRRAYAKQLKAYLAFSEQIMANYLAQLANVDRLFSIDEDLKQSYFFQIPEDIPNFQDIALGYKKAFGHSLEQLNHQFDPFEKRRNRFLNHLLARFGEYFQTAFLMQQKGQEGELEMIDAKIKLLQNYPKLSSNRSKGNNFSTGNHLTAIKQKMGILFNIKDCSDRDLATIFDGEEMESFIIEDQDLSVENIDITDKTDFVNAYQHKEESTDNEAINYKSEFIFASTENNLLQLLLHYGIHKKHYSILAAEDHFFVAFECPKIKATKVFEAPNKVACNEAIDQLVVFLKDLNKQSEGFHIIEHISLRPLHHKQYRFELLDDRGDQLLTSYRAAALENQRVLVNDLLIIGVIDNNFEAIEKEGVYTVFLNDAQGQRFARLSNTFSDLDSALAGISDTIAYLLELRKDNQALYSRIEFIVEGSQDFLLEKAPYSLRMSIVLPSWPQRFQNADFRFMFEDVFSKNAPAHLTLKFLWLDLEQMEAFEERYQAWLAEKTKKTPLQPDLDELSFKLLNYLCDLDTV